MEKSRASIRVDENTIVVYYDVGNICIYSMTDNDVDLERINYPEYKRLEREYGKNRKRVDTKSNTGTEQKDQEVECRVG
jgi:hypothetical protein